MIWVVSWISVMLKVWKWCHFQGEPTTRQWILVGSTRNPTDAEWTVLWMCFSPDWFLASQAACQTGRYDTYFEQPQKLVISNGKTSSPFSRVPAVDCRIPCLRKRLILRVYLSCLVGERVHPNTFDQCPRKHPSTQHFRPISTAKNHVATWNFLKIMGMSNSSTRIIQ